MITTVNPFTGKVLGVYPELTPEQLKTKLDLARKAYARWSTLSFSQRGEYFDKLAQLLKDKREELARLITVEMGKIIAESRAEIDKCAWLCEHYARHAEEMLRREFFDTDASKSYVRFDPVGTIYGIMPWNFPFWQVLRAAVPTMMAGNVFVLKHAPNVTGSAVAIEKLFAEAGFPEHVFINLIIPIELSESVIAHPAVQGVTLTGSQRAGSVVAAQAGKYLKKSVLELGGSDPYIVLKDANFNESCKTGVCSRFLNAGQVCISAKRFIVEKPVLEQFVEEQKALLESMVLGDPMDEQTEMGPMARPDLLENLRRQVDESVKMGAKIITGGRRKKEGTLFYMPTLLTNVKKGMPVYDEETFGPVSVIIEAQDPWDAVRIANDTDYGLGASLWTEDLKLAEQLAARLEAGAVFINGMTKSDPRLPFGGTKRSGYGRELSYMGIREFVNAKTVWIK